MRPEVVDLGAVGGVVVDHDEQRQPQAGRGLELVQRHHRAAVAERGDGQAVRPRDAAPIAFAEAEPDRLERLGEDEAAASGTRRYIAGPAHEVPGVDDDRPLARAAGRRARSRTRAGRRSRRPWRRRTARRASGGRRCARGGRVRRPAAVAAASSSASSAVSVARASPTHGEVAAGRAERRRVDVDLHDARRIADERAVARRPVVRRAPNASTRRPAARARCASGEANPPEMPSEKGVAVEDPVGHRRGGEQRADARAQLLERLAAHREDRAAPGDDHRPLRAASSAAVTPRTASGAGAGAAGSARAARTGDGASRLQVERRFSSRRGARRARREAPARPRPSRSPGRWTRSGTAPTARRACPGRRRSSTAPRRRRVGGDARARRARLRRLGQPGHRVRQARPLVHRDAAQVR